jgi:hypothetical protein
MRRHPDSESVQNWLIRMPEQKSCFRTPVVDRVELEDAVKRKDNGRQDSAVIETEQANQSNGNQARDSAVSAGDLEETISQELVDEDVEVKSSEYVTRSGRTSKM